MSHLKELMKNDSAYIANTYARLPLGISSGKGVDCKDFDEKSYIDFSSGIGVNSLGFANQAWVTAVSEQINKLAHMSNLYYTLPQVELAKALTKATHMEKVFFANSGAEANEGAIKAARKYSSDKYGENRYEIITLENSFHGRTITTLAATGQQVFHQHFGPFTQGFSHVEANNWDAFKAKASDKTCAVMIELIQGEGGVLPLDYAYVQRLADYCQAHDVLLIVDEVQTGIGRTGKLLCSEWYDIQPDITTLAKGLGGGLPIGAVLFGEKTKDTLGFGDHATTFGGNPVVAAGASVVLDTLTSEFLAEVQEKGEYLKKEIENLSGVVEVSGKGLMLGVALDPSLATREILAALAEEGVIFLTAKDKLRLLPPLTISKNQLTRGVLALKKVLEEALSETLS